MIFYFSASLRICLGLFEEFSDDHFNIGYSRVNSISWMGVIDLGVERHCNKINKLQYLESKPNQLVF